MAIKTAFVVRKSDNEILNRIVVDDENKPKLPTSQKLVFPDEEKREETQDIGEKYGLVKPEVPENAFSIKQDEK